MRGTLGLKHTLCNDLKSVSMVSILSAHWSKSGQRENTGLSRRHRSTIEKLILFNIRKIPEQFGINLLLKGIKRVAS